MKLEKKALEDKNYLYIVENIFKKHGFAHAKESLENTKKYFPEYLNYKTQDINIKAYVSIKLNSTKIFRIMDSISLR